MCFFTGMPVAAQTVCGILNVELEGVYLYIARFLRILIYSLFNSVVKIVP